MALTRASLEAKIKNRYSKIDIIESLLLVQSSASGDFLTEAEALTLINETVDKSFVDNLGVNATELNGNAISRFMLLDNSPVPVFADGDVPAYQSSDGFFTSLTLSAVATSNSYNDLDDLPSLYAGFSVAGDSGSGAISSGSTLTIAGGTNVTTSFSAGTLTIDASGGTESDTLDSVTDRGNITTNNITVGNLTCDVLTANGSTFSLPQISTAGTGVTIIQQIVLTTITTTERNALTPIEGTIIANETTGALEYYNGTSWV